MHGSSHGRWIACACVSLSLRKHFTWKYPRTPSGRPCAQPCKGRRLWSEVWFRSDLSCLLTRLRLETWLESVVITAWSTTTMERFLRFLEFEKTMEQGRCRENNVTASDVRLKHLWQLPAGTIVRHRDHVNAMFQNLRNLVLAAVSKLLSWNFLALIRSSRRLDTYLQVVQMLNSDMTCVARACTHTRVRSEHDHDHDVTVAASMIVDWLILLHICMHARMYVWHPATCMPAAASGRFVEPSALNLSNFLKENFQLTLASFNCNALQALQCKALRDSYTESFRVLKDLS